MSDFLGREELLAPSKRRFSVVTLPDGRKVRLRSLTERERGMWDAEGYGKGGKRERVEDAKLRLLIISVVDGDGNLILRQPDVKELWDKDSAVVQAIYAEILKLNAAGPPDGDVLGNSDETEGDDSPSS